MSSFAGAFVAPSSSRLSRVEVSRASRGAGGRGSAMPVRATTRAVAAANNKMGKKNDIRGGDTSAASTKTNATSSTAAVSVAEAEKTTTAPTPYPGFVAPEVLPEVIVKMPSPGALDAIDERLWVPQTADVSFRPLLLNVSQGYYVNLLRVRGAGVLSRHRHPGPVHGWVLKGAGGSGEGRGS